MQVKTILKKPKLFSILKHRKKELTKEQFIKDMIAGVIVAVIALPLSIALGISSGVTPERGLITAIVAGLFISIFGGSRVQIGGPTGAFVVIVCGIIEKHGIDGLIIATFMAGVILVLLGLLNMGNLIKYIPKSITIGFTTGIAITLFSTQVKDILGLNIENVPSQFIPKWGVYFNNINTINIWALILTVISILIIIFTPKITSTIPGSLVALVIVSLITTIFKLPVATIGSTFHEISAAIPSPSLPNIGQGKIIALIAPAITIAFLGAIESLLSAVVADGMIDKKHDSNAELVGQGLANIGSAFFGGIPATGAIARTAANVKNGGRTPISGIVSALVLLLIMELLMPLIKYVPLAVLGGILAVVSFNMCEVRKLKEALLSNKVNMIEILLTFVLTVICDLVVAILVSMIVHIIINQVIKYKNKDLIETV